MRVHRVTSKLADDDIWGREALQIFVKEIGQGTLCLRKTREVNGLIDECGKTNCSRNWKGHNKA